MENLNTKVASAKNNVYIDVGFWGGVVPGNQVTELCSNKQIKRTIIISINSGSKYSSGTCYRTL